MITQWAIANLGLPLLKALGILLAIASAVLAIRRWGKQAEKTEQLQHALSNSFDRAKIDAASRAGQLPDNLLLAPSARR